MKITIYKLLGLIKDGKAPKKIKVFSKTFELIENTNVIKNMYVDEDGDTLFDDYWWGLNDEVIILDEEDEFIDIDTINICREEQSELAEKINEIIKNQKKIILALKENK